MTPIPSGNAGLHVGYEKAGLIFDALPIPWNAEAVIVEANVRLPGKAERDKRDFTLRLDDDAPAIAAEMIVTPKKHVPLRVLFRFAVPKQTCTAKTFWREHALGQVELPIIGAAEYAERVSAGMATVCATIGSRVVACRSFVATQVRNTYAAALIAGPGPLAAALDLGLSVSVERENGISVGTAAITLTAEQRRARQALVMVPLPKLRSIGVYRVSWHVGGRRLHSMSLRTVSKNTFLRSLRISATRFIAESASGTLQTHRSMPTLEDVVALCPVFCVSSGEAGMAGVAPFTLRMLVNDVLTTLAIEEGTLVTDGPTPLILAKVPVSTLAGVKHFTLATGERVLGNLPLVAAPKADFTAEGGFMPLDDYLWTPAAEEQLQDRLGKLLDET